MNSFVNRDLLGSRSTIRENKTGKKIKIVEIRYYELVKTLRNEGLSWGMISMYLARYHKFNISRDYLKDCFEQIMDNRAAEER